MFNFFKFLKLAIAIISVVLAIVTEVKKVTEQHFAEAQPA